MIYLGFAFFLQTFANKTFNFYFNNDFDIFLLIIDNDR